MKTLFLFILLSNSFILLKAQNTKPYYDYNSQQSQNSREAQKSLEGLADKTRTPNSKGSGYSSNNSLKESDLPIELQSKESRAKYYEAQEAYKKTQQEIATKKYWEQANIDNAIRLEREKEIAYSITYKLDQIEKYLKGTLYSELNQKEFAEILYINDLKRRRNEEQIDLSYYSFARDRLIKFHKDSTSIVVDSALVQMADACVLGTTIIPICEKLKIKFPERAANFEKIELLAYACAFGAMYPNATIKTNQEYYTASQYELASAEEKKQLLMGFYTLIKKYPDFSLEKRIGKVRIGQNPLYLLASSNDFPEIDNEERTKLYRDCLKVQHDYDYIIKKSSSTKRYSIYYEIEEVDLAPISKWLMENDDTYLKSLTMEDWKEIVKCLNIAPLHIGSSFRKNGYGQIPYAPLRKIVRQSN